MSEQDYTHEDDVPHITTPTKDIDESSTVEERLTTNTVNNILPARYLNKDSDGDVIEQPAELFERVADNVATAEYTFAKSAGKSKEEQREQFEEWRSEFEDLMKTLRFMPNSPTLMNAGNELQQLSACFVDSPGDSMEDIMETAKEAALIFKSGGGMGYAFHHLRPKGTIVSSTKGTSSGPISFMRLFDETCNQVKQGGVRRGAQMAIMRADHPDIGRFTVCKREEGAFDNFNISIGVTDEFVDAVRNEETYTLYAPSSDFEEPFETVEATEHFYSPEFADAPETVVDENIWRDYADSIEAWDWDSNETISLREKWEDTFEQAANSDSFETGESFELPARFIWDLMLDGAWRNGEPGLFHYDETNREHSFDVEEHPEYRIEATNPCAEQPLCEYEACNLGHVNLSLMMKDDSETLDEWLSSQDEYDKRESAVYDYMWENVDWEELQSVIHTGTRFLDNVVTMSDFPLEEIEDRVDDMRKIGLGVMGWAQLLYQMGIEYGSHESFAAARLIMNFIDKEAVVASHELAEERGPFDEWDKSKYADPTEYREWFRKHAHQDPEEWEDGYPIRNHNVTTVAPTGTTSMIADTSGGIEPVYNVAYKKNVGNDIQGDDMLVEFDDYFLRTLEANNVDVEDVKNEASEMMNENEFSSVRDLDTVPPSIAEIFVTTNDISSVEHGMMQRAFQEKVDSGISKTVNLPKESTHSDVHNAYMLALDDDTLGSPIKGLTVYRDQSRKEQVLTTQEYSDKEVEEAIELLEDIGYDISKEEQEDERVKISADD